MAKCPVLVPCVFALFSIGTLDFVRGQESSVESEDYFASDPARLVVDDDDQASSASRLASVLLMSFDTVVMGEFETIPADLENNPLEAMMISLPFSVSRSFKGAQSGSLEIDLMSDMLVYPGEEVSRYVKRIQLFNTLVEDLHGVRAELESLEQSLAAGVISREQYETERLEKAELEDELLRQGTKIEMRRADAIHMETFYDRGGAIRPGTPYLLGLDQAGNLEELPSSTNVYWGPMMDDIVSHLE